VRIAVLHCSIHVPVDRQNFRGKLRKCLIEIVNLHLVRRQLHDLSLRNNEILVRVRNQRSQVRRNKGTGVRVGSYKRADASDRINRTRLIVKHDTEAVRTAQLLLKFADCFERIAIIERVEYPCSNLTVGLGDQSVF